MVQWLRLHAPNAGGMGLIPGQGTKIPHAAWRSQRGEKKRTRLWSEDLNVIPGEIT